MYDTGEYHEVWVYNISVITDAIFIFSKWNYDLNHRSQLAFSPDSLWLAAGAGWTTGDVRMWSMESEPPKEVSCPAELV